MICETILLPGGAKLDAFRQTWAPFPGTSVRRAAVIVCPGGGYAVLSRTEGEAVALAFAAQGLDAFVLRYRTGERAVWPNPLVDATQAVAHVRAQADAWQIDPDKIALAGFSAGGHVSASLGTMWPQADLHARAGAGAEAIRPNALILGYPALSLRIARESDMPAMLTGGRPVDALLAETETADFVGSHTPPTFLWTIFDDGAIPVEQGLAFCQRLAEHEVPFELHTFAHGEHASSLGTAATALGGAEHPHTAHWFPLCCAWLRSLFGAPQLVGAPPAMGGFGGGGRAHPAP